MLCSKIVHITGIKRFGVCSYRKIINFTVRRLTQLHHMKFSFLSQISFSENKHASGFGVGLTAALGTMVCHLCLSYW